MEIQNLPRDSTHFKCKTNHISEVYFRLDPGYHHDRLSSITPFIKPHCDDAVIKEKGLCLGQRVTTILGVGCAAARAINQSEVRATK